MQTLICFRLEPEELSATNLFETFQIGWGVQTVPAAAASASAAESIHMMQRLDP